MLARSLKLSEILNNLGHVDPMEDIIIENICTDSRKITPNSLFIAINGDNFNGHDFVKLAISNGALFAIVENKYITRYPEEFKNKLIAVDDSLSAYGKIANYYLSKFNLEIIAITGSAGKTTTKEYLKAILNKKYEVCASEKSFNNRIGVPQTIFNLKNNDEMLILEMGINQREEMDFLLNIAKPNIGVITNVGRSHIGNFGEIENIAKEKAKILNALTERGIAFVNYDDEQIANVTEHLRSRKLYFSADDNKRAEFRLKSYHIDENLKSRATFVFYDREFEVTVSAIGKHLVIDVLIASAIGFELGVRIDSIQEALSENLNLPMRMQTVKKGDSLIVLDCYNANPESTISLIKTARVIKNVKRSLLIMGDMLELGDHSAIQHYEIGKAARRSGIDNIFSIGEFGKYVLEGANLAPDGRLFATLAELNEKVKEIFRTYDLILIKGSRRMKMESVFEFLKKEELQ